MIAPHKILIVDDERPAREFIAELVAFYIPNSTITQADSLRNALDSLQAEDFDVMFLDIDFGAGKRTGLDLLEEVNRMKKHIYTVIISAHYRFDYAVKGMELGAARYIPKPPADDSSESAKTSDIQYITKPLYKEKIFDAIRLYLEKIKNSTIDLRVLDGFRRISIGDLLAVETINRNKLKIYTTDALWSDAIGSLAQLFVDLPANFCYIRRNCIINLHAVKHYNLKSYLREIHVGYQDKEYSFVVSRENIKNLAVRLHFDNLEKNEY